MRGSAACSTCFRRGVAAGRWVAILVPLAFLAVVAAFFGAMVWFFPEITRR